MPTDERFSRKGRGALSNRTGRFEPRETVAFDDGWGSLEQALGESTRPATTITPEHPRSILATNDSPDVPFEQSINPYKGCEHGCTYCFARPTHSYLGLSPGIDFETKIFSKPNAAELLRRTFAKRSYIPKMIAIGANTDPYQPAERKLKITRDILEVMVEHRHPCGIVTKSQGVLRDIDRLQELAKDDLVLVMVSITTLDPKLARSMEPRASSPAARLAVIEKLAESGIPVGVLSSPMIPSLNDTELESILEAAANAGATSASYILLRLTQEVAELFSEWLMEHFPDRAEHVLSILRQAHGGQLYRSNFGERMAGRGAWASMLRKRYELATKRLGLNQRDLDLRTDLFRRPPREGDQLRLL